jgi:hypothetical protein
MTSSGRVTVIGLVPTKTFESLASCSILSFFSSSSKISKFASKESLIYSPTCLF